MKIYIKLKQWLLQAQSHILSKKRLNQEYNGRSPRQNAIYYLAVASAFKEKPWLQQLEIARTLAKKSVCKPVN
ncbi:hypothetical protein Y1Q_0024559 [Alligator mississippiensis]|uniref:Uncharacterized protein n=1 Tax=Alligator mississippiensis TaxID=8496 RepID=A0A151NAU4_ALLMI|nr:hypothetical protein Y1Q_0024559 [Alligator mississippiensis]